MGGPKKPTPQEWFNQIGKDAEQFFGALGKELKKDFEDLTETMTTGQLPENFVKQEQERVEEKTREAETALAEAMKADKTLVTILSAVPGNMAIATQLSNEHIDKIDRAKAENKTPPSLNDLIQAIKQKDKENAAAAKALLDSIAHQNPEIAVLVHPETGSMPATALQIAREHLTANIIAGINNTSPEALQRFIDALQKEDKRQEDMARKILADSLGNENPGQATLTVLVAQDGNMEKAQLCTRQYVDSIEEAKSKGEAEPSHQEYARNLARIMVSFGDKPTPKPKTQYPPKPNENQLAIDSPLPNARFENNSTSSIRSTLTESATDLARQSKRRLRALKQPENENIYQSETHNNGSIRSIRGEAFIAKQIEQEYRKETAALAQDAARLQETMNDTGGVLKDADMQLKNVETNVKDAEGSTDRAVTNLEEAQKTQQEVIRMRLMIATIACGAVSVGCTAWLLQTLGSSAYLTLAAAIVTALAVAATATCGGLFAAKQKQAKAQQAGQDNAQPGSPQTGKQ